MRIVDRASDTARTISNDEICWRRLTTGAILAGGLALASGAAGAATVGSDGQETATMTPTRPSDYAGAATIPTGNLRIDGSLSHMSLPVSGATLWAANLTTDVGGVINDLSAGVTLDNSGSVANNGTQVGVVNSTGGLTNTGIVDLRGLISGNTVNGTVLNVGASTLFDLGDLTNGATGIINIAGGTIAAAAIINAGTISVSGLSTINSSLTNSGLINLQNGVAGDRLTVTGNFVGLAGSTIALDVNARTGTADEIAIGGSASGSTTLNVAGLAPGNPFTVGSNLVVVQGSTSPNAFTLGNPLNLGTLSVVLVPQATATGVTFATATVASVAGLSGSIATSAAQTTSFVSNGVAFDRMADLRNSLSRNLYQGTGVAAMAYAQELAKNDPISSYVRAEAASVASASIGSPKPAVWIRGYGDYEQRDGQANFNFAGTNFTSNLGYRQGTGGVMGGIDSVWSGLTTATDGLVLGLLGGYTTSRVELRDSPTTQAFSGPSVGAYGTYFAGNWFFDLLFKVDLLSLDINIPGMSQSANPINYNLASNIGYKFDLANRYYIEPTAGLEYVRTNFDHATALTATSVALNDGDALRARAGARIGTEWVTSNMRVEPSLLAQVYEVAAATNNALLVNGTSISMPSDVGRARGEVQGLVNVLNLQTGLSGFARVDTRFGEGLLSVGGRAGMRYQW